MANSQTPAELKNCKLENPSPLFRPLAQYLGSDRQRVLSPSITYIWVICHIFVIGLLVICTNSLVIFSSAANAFITSLFVTNSLNQEFSLQKVYRAVYMGRVEVAVKMMREGTMHQEDFIEE